MVAQKLLPNTFCENESGLQNKIQSLSNFGSKNE